MRVFIPSKGRPYQVATNEQRWADQRLTWLVDEAEAAQYSAAGARSVQPAQRGRFGKAQCINWVLRSRNLAGEWVLLTDDDVLHLCLWDAGRGAWRKATAQEALDELQLAMDAADVRGLPLATGLSYYQNFWLYPLPVDPPAERVRVGLPPHGRTCGSLHLVKVGRLPEIPVTYDDELMVTLRAVQTGGAVAEALRVFFMPDDAQYGINGHGPESSRDYRHSIVTVEREFPGMTEFHNGHPRLKVAQGKHICWSF